MEVESVYIENSPNPPSLRGLPEKARAPCEALRLTTEDVRGVSMPKHYRHTCIYQMLF